MNVIHTPDNSHSFTRMNITHWGFIKNRNTYSAHARLTLGPIQSKHVTAYLAGWLIITIMYYEKRRWSWPRVYFYFRKPYCDIINKSIRVSHSSPSYRREAVESSLSKVMQNSHVTAYYNMYLLYSHSQLL